MAISHVCMSCGLDLARVRARLEPRYALPIVVCPDCGRTAVRRKPREWRSLGRLVRSLLTLVAQLGMVVGGLAGLMAVSIEMGDVLVRGSFGALPRDEIILRLAVCATFAVVLGTWLTAGLGHARRVTTWIVFSGFGIAVVSLGSLIGGRLDLLVARCLVVAVIMTVATAGIPMGMLAQLAWGPVERAGWQLHRRRLRARSAGR